MSRAPPIGFEALPGEPRRCELLTTFEPRTAYRTFGRRQQLPSRAGPVRDECQKINRRIRGWFRAGYLRSAGKRRGNAPRNCEASPGGFPRHCRLIAQAKSRQGKRMFVSRGRLTVFPRLSRCKVAQETDDRVRLVFSACRSIPAFPTPLRRVIGHHWPWYRLPGPMAFLGG